MNKNQTQKFQAYDVYDDGMIREPSPSPDPVRLSVPSDCPLQEAPITQN